VYSYWREFGARYVSALCTRQDGDAPAKRARVPSLPGQELERMALGARP